MNCEQCLSLWVHTADFKIQLCCGPQSPSKENVTAFSKPSVTSLRVDFQSWTQIFWETKHKWTYKLLLANIIYLFIFLTCRTFLWDHSGIKYGIQWFLLWRCQLSPLLHSDADQACVLKLAWFNPRPSETLGCRSTNSEQTECPQPENTLKAEKHFPPSRPAELFESIIWLYFD